jgi:hypothetical protein
MGERKQRHLEADEGVGEAERDVLVVGVGPEFGDTAELDEDGDGDRLPECEEEDAFDAEEFGGRAKGSLLSALDGWQ